MSLIFSSNIVEQKLNMQDLGWSLGVWILACAPQQGHSSLYTPAVVDSVYVVAEEMVHKQLQNAHSLKPLVPSVMNL